MSWCRNYICVVIHRQRTHTHTHTRTHQAGGGGSDNACSYYLCMRPHNGSGNACSYYLCMRPHNGYLCMRVCVLIMNLCVCVIMTIYVCMRPHNGIGKACSYYLCMRPHNTTYVSSNYKTCVIMDDTWHVSSALYHPWYMSCIISLSTIYVLILL